VRNDFVGVAFKMAEVATDEGTLGVMNRTSRRTSDRILGW
jgi:hypothetical protein